MCFIPKQIYINHYIKVNFWIRVGFIILIVFGLSIMIKGTDADPKPIEKTPQNMNYKDEPYSEKCYPCHLVDPKGGYE